MSDRSARLCGQLRCKDYYVSGDLEPGLDDDTAVWWCASTQRVVGPDEAPVLPESCGAARNCYETPEVA